MTEQDIERTDERADERTHGPGPWWAGLGTWGAIGLVVFGVLWAVWVFLRLPGAPENPATGYYQAAKVLAVGLVLAGSSLLSRRRSAR